MNTTKLNLLEAKIERFIEQFNVLKEQKGQLEERVIALQRELTKHQQGPSEALKQENSALREAREAARSKIEGLLQRLETMDLG